MQGLLNIVECIAVVLTQTGRVAFVFRISWVDSKHGLNLVASLCCKPSAGPESQIPGLYLEWTGLWMTSWQPNIAKWPASELDWQQSRKDWWKTSKHGAERNKIGSITSFGSIWLCSYQQYKKWKSSQVRTTHASYRSTLSSMHQSAINWSGP